MGDLNKRHENANWLYERRIAHRGLHDKDHPENSMAAFRRAVEHGYNIEIDVHLIKDGTIAVFHDGTLRRMCGVAGSISDQTAESLKELYLNGTDQTIPTLQELLELLEGSESGLLVEFKNFTPKKAAEKAAYELLKSYNVKYAVQSFNPFSVGWFRRNAPDVYRGQLAASAPSRVLKSFTYALKSLRFRRFNKPDFIAYFVKNLPNKYVNTARGEGRKILCWTVKTPEDQAIALEHCDNYIFDDLLPDDMVGA